LRVVSPVHFYITRALAKGSSCTHGFEGLHGSCCVAADRLQVDVHRRDVCMTQDLLNHFVRDAKAMKIRRQATPERMPAMPFGTRLFSRGPNRVPPALLSARAPQRLRTHPSLWIPRQSLSGFPLGSIPTTAVQQFLHAARSWNLQSFRGEFFCLALPTLRRDHDRGSETYGCGIIYLHILRFVVAHASLLLLRCAPALRPIRPVFHGLCPCQSETL